MPFTDIVEKTCAVCSKTVDVEPALANVDALCEDHAGWEECGNCEEWTAPGQLDDGWCASCRENESSDEDEDEDDSHSCWNCGDTFSEDDGYRDKDGDWTCGSCYYPFCHSCDDCSETRDEMEETDAGFLCSKCQQKKADAEEASTERYPCPKCGKTETIRLVGYIKAKFEVRRKTSDRHFDILWNPENAETLGAQPMSHPPAQRIECSDCGVIQEDVVGVYKHE